MENLKAEVKQGKVDITTELVVTGIFGGITVNLRSKVIAGKGTTKETVISDTTISEAVNFDLQDLAGIKDFKGITLESEIQKAIDKAKASQAL